MFKNLTLSEQPRPPGLTDGSLSPEGVHSRGFSQAIDVNWAASRTFAMFYDKHSFALLGELIIRCYCVIYDTFIVLLKAAPYFIWLNENLGHLLLGVCQQTRADKTQLSD